jgi:uncharacterized protein (UPF0548 family)
MFLLRRPQPPFLDDTIRRVERLPLTYSPIGLARDTSVPGFRIAEARTVLGHGEDVYRRAVLALGKWRGFDLGWASIYPTDAPVVPGTTVLVVARHFGFWSVNACRIVYTVPGDTPSAVEGFAYGTLPEHAETGEEIFTVSFDRESGAVTYLIRAVSHERALLARLGAPVARALQDRFRRDSVAAMQRYIAETS